MNQFFLKGIVSKSDKMPLIALAATTILSFAVSIFCMLNDYYIIFQNVFYIPIIIACMYFFKRGFIFSVILTCIYLIITIIFSENTGISLQALIRVFMFLLMAVVITYISLERKRTEEALLMKNLVFDASIAANSIADLNGNIIQANTAFLSTWDYQSMDEVIGKPLLDFIQNKDEAVAIITALNETGEWEGDYTAKRKDGSTFIAHGMATDVRDANSKMIGYQSAVLDITERKQSEEALRLSERKLNIMNEIANIFLTIPDEEMYAETLKVILEVMASKFGVFGYINEEGALVVPTMTRTIWEQCEVPEKDIVFPRETWGNSAWPRAIKEGKMNFSNETSTITPKGHIPIERHLTMPIVYQGVSIGLIQVANKLTNYSDEDIAMLETLGAAIAPVLDARLNREKQEAKRERAEESLREANENLELTVLERTSELEKSKKLLDEAGKLARIGAWEIDLKENELNWSDMVYEIHEVEPGFKPTVENGINFYAPEAIPVISKCIEEAITNGKSFDVELQLMTAKQNRLWVRTMGKAYRENGEITKVSGVFQDIHSRKLVEIESLEKSRQLRLLSTELEIIIDSIPGLVFYKDTNNRFLRVNKYMAEAYKMSKKEMEGVHLNDLHTPEEAQTYYEDDLQVINSRKPKLNIDEPWETETGKRWVNTSKIPYIDEKGEVVGVIGISMDVTERKLAEEELEKHREHLEELVNERTEEIEKVVKDLERSNKELEQFAYVASHDLQEPLRMVSSFTQLLARKYKDSLDSDAMEFIKFAVDGATRMQLLINDLLEFSRVSTRGKSFERVDCASVLGIVRKTLHNRVEETNALISNEDLPIILGDESQLIRLFQNLIENALKFYGTEPPRILISAKDMGKEWQFSVKDNGIGIDSEFKDRIFTIFQRLHGRDEYPGTGIGLAVSKRIVERHGGKIWVESEKDKGTTFFFTIPKNNC
ncbi:PAS domain S-box protein [Bacteroidota bacterium]